VSSASSGCIPKHAPARFLPRPERETRRGRERGYESGEYGWASSEQEEVPCEKRLGASVLKRARPSSAVMWRAYTGGDGRRARSAVRRQGEEKGLSQRVNVS
jgi:hypothetical protein